MPTMRHASAWHASVCVCDISCFRHFVPLLPLGCLDPSYCPSLSLLLATPLLPSFLTCTTLPELSSAIARNGPSATQQNMPAAASRDTANTERSDMIAARSAAWFMTSRCATQGSLSLRIYGQLRMASFSVADWLATNPAASCNSVHVSQPTQLGAGWTKSSAAASTDTAGGSTSSSSVTYSFNDTSGACHIYDIFCAAL